MTQQWEEVEVPRGAYISWGNAIGQTVVGRVITYSDTGGTDFNEKPCPQLELELVEPAYSINKEGIRSDHLAGEFVVLNCGGANMQRGVRKAALDPGDLVRITLKAIEPLPGGKSVKVFGFQVLRGGGSYVPAQQPAQPAQAYAPPAAAYQAPTAAQPAAPAIDPAAAAAALAQITPEQRAALGL